MAIKQLLLPVRHVRSVFQLTSSNPPALAELDPIALDSRRLGPARLVAAAIIVALVGFDGSWNISALARIGGSWNIALVWGAGVLASEAWMRIATRPHARGRPISRADRLSFMGSALACVFPWLSLSVMFWVSPERGSQFVALLIWACLLLNAISIAFRSTLALAIFGLPVCLVMIVTPLALPVFSDARQLTVNAGVLIFILYAGLSARRSVLASRTLAEASLELERQREAAEAANAAKSAFLATMSHEIRTPLNGVLGMAQAMAREDMPDVQRDRLSAIRSSGETLLVLLNDLLDLSRIESGRMELEDGIVDVDELVRTSQALFTDLASEKDIGLAAEVRPEAQGLWRGDSTRVRQILHNLVSNAVKFTGAGSVQIVVSHDGRHLVIEVIDTGPGIAPQRLGALFEKFVQVDASTTRRFGGSGLGLSICRDLATLMQGEIGVRSEPGQGSTFTVKLPLVRAQAAPPLAAETGASAIEGRPLRILAVEDNVTNQLVLKTLLAQLGFEVAIAENGALAVEASASGAWDLILMDVQMPVMDGPTATRLIRAREAAEGARRTPILALTANAMAHQADEYVAAGMDGAVAKPIQLDQLLAAMDAVLQPASAEAASTRLSA
ncbi:MAG: sensor histidine kinase/response regulator [Caulobacteraceae bacterium]|nr:sensor histidine kinase/response regulator [Caulobacteraceae bacterium]